ncbi:MAG: type II toxin-antitoxin system HicB family antitoxin [candidate division SR1 bacterium]|nr:type II toxin-antitoxin system HicB family antitoxin [candidate division SR1 bacterium]
MFENYISYVFKNLKYEVDENGVIIAKAQGYDGYYSQGDTYEEARNNLMDAIQGIILLKLELGDKNMISELRKFNIPKEHHYA